MSFLLYGAYGYTGRLIAEMAVARGRKPVLAGRDAGQLAAMATSLDLACRAFSLDDQVALDEALANVPVVLHCAGPFIRTVDPMAAACLRTGTHYLDITGEIAVYERLAALHDHAVADGVMLLPGVGFDVVPSDCLALYLNRRVPSATHLELAVMGTAGLSHGTATTAIENIGKGGAIRRNGVLTRVPAAWKKRTVDFGRGPREVVSIPWGDVFTAYHSTGIPDIVVYARLGPWLPRLLQMTRYTGGLLASAPAQALFKWWIDRRPPGPDTHARKTGRSFVWGTAWDDDGKRATARLQGPEGYTLTALAALAAVDKVLSGEVTPGFQTPSRVYGADFILEIDGMTREDIAHTALHHKSKTAS